ncbi:hypothetical protein CC1G_13511 [Coprinopsis cinerea okayama7|uniref:Uncharacterized protein n=1 Tax=Coprinopsis cinerea (strain Okayama-7 / 130 / ATCC MYA-4618 / FGSC 9003) TaxID=240176 RepID=A8PJ35_COPC7|nr:hypothetical protein CC1G_13511 [Coprinopsis cinerea okayama7\|eukprot:XP_001841660.2 hypothetical protein CC1G_13511 [Coprinopsis cinerea okayama7\
MAHSSSKLAIEAVRKYIESVPCAYVQGLLIPADKPYPMLVPVPVLAPPGHKYEPTAVNATMYLTNSALPLDFLYFQLKCRGISAEILTGCIFEQMSFSGNANLTLQKMIASSRVHGHLLTVLVDLDGYLVSAETRDVKAMCNGHLGIAGAFLHKAADWDATAAYDKLQVPRELFSDPLPIFDNITSIRANAHAWRRLGLNKAPP